MGLTTWIIVWKVISYRKSLRIYFICFPSLKEGKDISKISYHIHCPYLKPIASYILSTFSVVCGKRRISTRYSIMARRRIPFNSSANLFVHSYIIKSKEERIKCQVLNPRIFKQKPINCSMNHSSITSLLFLNKDRHHPHECSRLFISEMFHLRINISENSWIALELKIINQWASLSKALKWAKIWYMI